MKVVLNTGFGPMWLPPESTLWLLGKEGTQGLFDYGPITESPFALRAVYSCIEDDEKGFARHINDRWATWNWYMVDTERNFLLDYSTDLQIGHHRENEHLIECVERRDPEEMAIVDISDDKDYEIVQDTWGSEAVRLQTAELVTPEG